MLPSVGPRPTPAPQCAAESTAGAESSAAYWRDARRVCDGAAVPIATPLVRDARTDDCEAICRVHAAAVHEICATHYAPHEIAAWTGRLSPQAYLAPIITQEFVVAERDGTVVGFGQVELVTAVVEAVYVDPRSVRQRIGSMLVEALERRARASGLRRLHLDASLNSVPFYQTLGFRPIAEARHLLAPGVTVACVIMEKLLAPAF